ncbi:Rrf2 family protein [Peptoniphilus koenoeneniae]|uniref:Rrf2 family protein n=1 Tax=Peptoniphilus koenoeneniae TaxID=507751 RepID=A0ABU0ASP8_9FIRM|nr:Rrf2 family transcriptional regulator [Peptoniphilus koenoeneniae]MDQ0274255.1 Rrf2 family protein [Peptoniphilus koenoeneniae]
MRITQETDYAFRICAYLAERENEVIGAPEISEVQKIPKRFTLRILRKLNLAGITAAKRGAYGGYYLLKPKEKVTLYDIILAIDGPIIVNKCLSESSPYCSKNGKKGIDHCKFHKRLSAIQSNIAKMFKDSTIDEFI